MSTPEIALLASMTILLCGCHRGDTASKGFIIDVAKTLKSCGDGRTIVVTAIGNHRVKVNSEPDIPTAQLAPILRDILKTRFQRVVFVKGNADISFGDFAELVDHVRPVDAIISLVSSKLLPLGLRTMCLGVSCGRCEKERAAAKYNQ
jgi:hypothetical protein